MRSRTTRRFVSFSEGFDTDVATEKTEEQVDDNSEEEAKGEIVKVETYEYFNE
uniref:Uncharacterized protein n=1 Tax=Triticum urartu TaxID=4572 RepID=A0A8R7TWP1_TRIUA